MMHVSNAEFVAANANAGIFTCLASAMFPREQELVDEIKKVKDLTDKPFGVNISLFPALLPRPVEQTLDTAAQQEVGVIETAGGSPEPYRERIRGTGFLHIHKCARERDAVKAEKLGADIVAVVGTECGGHPSMEDVTSLVLIPTVADRIRIPLVAGGGFCDGRSLVAALALGADAMLAGTRFLNSLECRIHAKMKERLIQAKETDTVVIQRSIGSARRVLKNAWAEKVLAMERKGATREELARLISGKRAGHAWLHGEDDAVFACGQVVGRTKETLSIKDLVEKIMSEAEETKKRIAGQGV
jgi:nitronate monooxygenase